MRSKVLAIATISAAAFTAMAYAPIAGDTYPGPYVALRGSLAFQDDVRASTPVTGGTLGLRTSLDTGAGASVAVGYLTPWGVRLEAEGLYRYFQPSRGTLTDTTTSPPTVTSGPMHGQVQLIAPMLNAIYDIPIEDWPVQPFVGAGVGAAYVNARLATPGFGPTDDSNWAFAYQGIAGVAVPLSQSTTLRAMYRYFSAQKLHLFGAKFGSSEQSFDVGFDFRL